MFRSFYDRQRHRRFVTLLLLTVFFLAPGPVAVPGAAAPTQQGIGNLYLALGDSLGVGLLSSMPDTRGYVAQLHGLLERRAGHAIQLRNLSVSGETTHSFLTGGQLTAAQETLTEARRAGWRVSPITIDLGGNDLRALQGTDNAARAVGLAQFRTDLGQIFDALIAATTVDGARQSDIITMTVYNPYGGDSQVAYSDAWWVARFNAAITDEAAKRDVAVADVYMRFLGHERELTWVPLDFHPNNHGHRVIAEAFWRATGYDTTPPDLQLVEPASGPLARMVPTIKVRASDTMGVAHVTFRLDDQPLPDPIFARDLGLWIGYWDARAASSGPHRLTVSASDAAGNTTSQELTLTR